MIKGKRTEFSKAEIGMTLQYNWSQVLREWPDDFRNATSAHFMCEYCRYVSPRREDFEVDHIVNCEYGGDTAHVDAHMLAAAEAMDIEAIYAHGINAQVLCRGCNQSKKQGKHFVVPEAGYAYRRHSSDCNPDHMYSPPRPQPLEIAHHPEPYNVNRYRR
jgi:hypothetical protein